MEKSFDLQINGLMFKKFSLLDNVCVRKAPFPSQLWQNQEWKVIENGTKNFHLEGLKFPILKNSKMLMKEIQQGRCEVLDLTSWIGQDCKLYTYVDA